MTPVKIQFVLGLNEKSLLKKHKLYSTEKMEFKEILLILINY